MPSIYGTTGDGYASALGQSSWVNARRSSGTQGDNNNTRDTTAVAVEVASGKGGGVESSIRRAFMSFDTSGISVTPSDATLKIRGFSQSSADVIVVKSEAATTIVAGSFDDLPSAAQTVIGLTDGSGAGTLSGVSGFTYSSEISTWSTSGYNDIALNSTALSDMVSLDTFKICIMDYDYDYLDITGGSLVRVGLYWTETSAESLDPYIDYTAGTEAVTNNAILFGTNF